MDKFGYFLANWIVVDIPHPQLLCGLDRSNLKIALHIRFFCALSNFCKSDEAKLSRKNAKPEGSNRHRTPEEKQEAAQTRKRL